MQSNLKRNIKTRGLIAYYVTSLLGVGILIIPGIAAEIAGPASLLSWIALVLLSYPIAMVFAKMSIDSPDSSGIASFIQKAFGVKIGKTVGILLTLTMVIGNPVLGLATAHYLQNLFTIPDGWPFLLTGLGMMMLSVLFNLLGLKFGSKIQTFTLLILIVGLIGLVFFSLPHVKVEQLTPFNPNGWWSIGSAVVVCFFSFLGWENVSSIAEEVVDPVRTFKKAVRWAVVIVGILYLALAFAVITVIPKEAASNITVLNGLLTVIVGPIGAKIGNIIAVILLILTTNAWVLGASRLVYSLSRDRVLPKAISSISKRTGVPIMALLVLALSYFFIFILLMATHSNERILIQIANSNFLMIYLCGFMAGLKLFKTKSIRTATWIALISTAIMFPFFKIGLLYSIIFVALSYFLYIVTLRKEKKKNYFKGRIRNIKQI